MLKATWLVVVFLASSDATNRQVFSGRTSDSVPFGRTTACAKECPGGSTFAYEDNMVHVYDYHSSAKLLGGIREPQLAVTARVHITVAGPCEMILALSHVRLTGTSAPSADFAAALTSTPLRFAFHNGRVSNICPSTEEPVWVLNFKRAVLSTFQNNMVDLPNTRNPILVVQEIGVSGSCETGYSSVQLEPGVVNITKTRLGSCVSRPVPETNNRLESLLQLLPVFSNEQICHQKIAERVLQESTCREYIRYPEMLDYPERLPIVAIVTSLQMAYQFKADFVVIPNYNATRATLVQDWEVLNPDPPTDWLDIVRNIFEEFEVVSPTPDLFYSLVELLKTLNYDQMHQIFINLSPKLWNTAAMSLMGMGTESAMKMIADFAANGVIEGDTLIDAIQNIAKKFGINSPMIDLLKRLIQAETNNNIGLTKVKNYCIANSTCQADKRISDIFAIVDRNVNPTCKESKGSEGRSAKNLNPEHKQVEDEFASEFGTSYVTYSVNSVYTNVDSLNTLRDLGHWNENTSNSIEKCVRSTEPEERYAALEALLKSPCGSHQYESLIPMFKDNTLDNVTQILLYRTLIRCIPNTFKEEVYNKLLHQPVTHATSYIWTHIVNFQSELNMESTASESRFTGKFHPHHLLMSRNYRKDFVISNKTFTKEKDIIFSGHSARPKYIALRISSKDFSPNDIFELVIREKKETSNSWVFGGTHKKPEQVEKNETFVQVRASIFGYQTYFKERSLDKKISFWTVDELYSSGFTFVYKIFRKMTIEYLYQFFTRLGSVSYLKGLDILLKYPTSMGMPINIKMNVTKGSHEGTLLLAYAKKLEAQLSLDATHAKIGSRATALFEFLPRINASANRREVMLQFGLPEKRNKLVNIEYSAHTFEDDEIYPNYFENETIAESACIPGLQEFTGFGFCLDYAPRIRYWPVYFLKYGLTYVRNDSLKGVDVIYRSSSRNNLKDISVKSAGSDTTWRIMLYDLAQFVNINLTTPYFSMNGSGIYREDVLFFKEPGQAVNISGLFRYNGEEAPFVLTIDLITEDGNEKKSIHVDFKSSILDTNIASSYISGGNRSLLISVPYKFKGENPQRFRISAGSTEISSITSSRRNNIETPEETTFGRDVYSLSIGTTKYKKPLLKIEAVDERGADIDTKTISITMEADDVSIDVQCSLLDTNHTQDGNITAVYTDKDKTYEFDKKMSLGDNTAKIDSYLISKNDTLFVLNATYRNDSGNGCVSDATFVIPNNEVDATHPIFKMTHNRVMNYSSQQFYFSCNNTYGEKNYFKVNSIVQEIPSPNPAVRHQENNYVGLFEVDCDKGEAFRVSGNTRYGAHQKMFEMNVDVETPVTIWNNKAFSVQIRKLDTIHHHKFIDKRFNKEVVYSLDGRTDHDPIDNAIKYLKERAGKPEVQKVA